MGGIGGGDAAEGVGDGGLELVSGAGRGGGRGTPSPEALQRNLEDVEASVKWTQDFLAKA